MMINFDTLERNQVMMRDEFLNNSPFEHIIIENFCNEKNLDDPINFPSGTYRTSIAAYGYTETGEVGKLRTTVWKPEKSNILKRFLGKHMPKIVSVKTRIFGSGTTKNK